MNSNSSMNGLAPKLDPKGIDGLISRPPRKSNTVAAIEAFETFFGITAAGLIEPDGDTWKALGKALGKADGEAIT